MIANALFASAAFTLALLFFLISQLRFLLPYRPMLIHHYGPAILLYATLLFINLTAAVFSLGRRFFLKDTGRKLAHFDRELNAGRTPMPPHLHREELN
jgi:hypothetical protein